MRKNIQQVFAAWLAGNKLDLDSIRTDGVDIFSYHTPILTREGMVLNTAKYSATTSGQQGSLKVLLNKHGITYNEQA